MTRGKLITFEGGEGCGKSTQARHLKAVLAARGIDVVLTREPGGSAFGERVRDLILDPALPPHTPLAEAFLFYAARSDHLAQIIRPALAAGRWVISDRFSDSTWVYQCHAGGLDQGAFDTLERLVVGDTKPAVTVVLDLAPEIGLARAGARRTTGEHAAAADGYERRDIAFHDRLRAGFLAIAERSPDRVIVVDASGREEDIAARVTSEIFARLGLD